MYINISGYKALYKTKATSARVGYASYKRRSFCIDTCVKEQDKLCDIKQQPPLDDRK